MLIARRIVLTSSYAAISSTTLIGCITLVAAGDNAGVAYMQGDDDATNVEIPKSIPFDIRGVDMALIKLKGTPGDIVTVIGYSPST